MSSGEDQCALTEPKRGRGRPRDPEKRQAILNAARGLFMERGIASTTIEGVAERARVSKMTVYAYFADKSALLKAVFQRSPMNSGVAEIGACASAEDAFERLVAYGIRFAVYLTRPEIVAADRTVTESARSDPELAAAFFEAGPQANIDRVAKFLAVSAAQGYWRIEEPALAAEALLGAWLGMERERQTMSRATPDPPDTVARRVRAITEMFVRGWRA